MGTNAMATFMANGVSEERIKIN